MGRVFSVELSGKDWSRELELPATDHQLLDALEIIKMKPGELPEWEILNCERFEYLYPYLNGECSIYELNALSRRLGGMDNGQLAAFEGLCKIALSRREGPTSMSDLMTYANSTECCHVVGNALNDAQLGRFYAENGFVAELEDIPDSVFEKLDFAKIGKEMREAEGGVYTRYGYVLQNAALKPIGEPFAVIPQTPDYAFLLAVSRYPFEDDDSPEKWTDLKLPATEKQLVQALEEIAAASWDEVALYEKDCAMPGAVEALAFSGIPELNRLAKMMKKLEADGELPKLKAVLIATDCPDVSTAIEIAENLDAYIHEPSLRDAADVARAELKTILADETRAVLEKHINLYAYGEELMAGFHSMMTPYGTVERRDGQPLQTEQPSQGGMEMM